MSVSRVGSSDFGAGGGELDTGGVGGVVCVGVEGAGGTFLSCGNETVSGVIKENASEVLFGSFRSTGDFIAMMLVGEAGPLSKRIGDEGAEDTRLIALFSGKTVIPHLLAGRAGAGVDNGGVTEEFRSGGGGGGSGRIATSTVP